jgi:hypothetical protein
MMGQLQCLSMFLAELLTKIAPPQLTLTVSERSREQEFF